MVTSMSEKEEDVVHRSMLGPRTAHCLVHNNNFSMNIWDEEHIKLYNCVSWWKSQLAGITSLHPQGHGGNTKIFLFL